MADTLCSSSSSSYNLKKNPSFQPITCIILHDLSLLCSFITSHPLYFSYFIFFSRYFIKLISFISPLFIAAVFLSLLLTTTTAICPKLPQLELGILQTVINELKSNFDEANEEENDRNFEDFEIYKIVFDGTLSSTIRSEGDEDMAVTKKILEHSVNCGWRNDGRTNYSDLDELGFEKLSEISLHGGRRTEATITDDKLGVEKTPEIAAHGGRRNEATITDGKLCVEKTPEIAVHGGRKIEATITDDKLGVEKTLEVSVHGGRKIEAKITVDRLCEEKTPETAVNGCRKNEATIRDTGSDKLDVEKTPENSLHGGRRIGVTVTDSYVDELYGFEDFTMATETKADSGEVTGELERAIAGPVRRVCSVPAAINSSDDDKFSQSSVRSSSWRSNSSSVLTSDGSMMLEWRRTLACKLFEERHNSRGGEEGMDSLWEAYEDDNSKNRKEIMVKNKVMMMKMKMSSNNGGIQRFEDDDDDDEGDEDDDVEMSNGHLCCLQALKLSTRKMNLGMGKPNLVKISKALKGFGWLHRVKNKHGGKRC